jgi:hypothetical protein
MSLSRSGAVLAVAFVLAGCGLSASPADGLSFHAPAGWRSSPGIMGFMQFWRPPVDDREVLMLIKSPRPLKSSDIFSDARMNDTLKGATVERRQEILICNRQPAMYFEARGTSSQGGDARVEAVMTNMSGGTYFAMYIRPIAAAPNPTAQASLRELCAKT